MTTTRGRRLLRAVGTLMISLLAAACVVAAVSQAGVLDAQSARAAGQYRPTDPYTPPARPVVAFIGDSYSAGVGASEPEAGFVSIVSAREGWNEVNDSRGGTGYYATNGKAGCGLAFCPNYNGMIATVKKARPSIIVVSGGRNDAAFPQETVGAAIDTFYTNLRKAFPETRIYVTSPIWDARTPPPTFQPIVDEVRQQAKRIDATYVDLGKPFVDRPALISADDVHPNDRGHALLANRIVDRLPAGASSR